MLIRAALTSDVEAIAVVHAAAIREVCAQVYEPSQIHAWISGKTLERYRRAVAEHPVFVAVHDGSVVGFSEFEPKTEEVFAVYVHPAFLRQRVGSALLGALEKSAAEHGLSRLHLHATINAIPFYRAHGFELDAMTSFPLGAEASLACARMHKTLPGFSRQLP